jgi:tetratricopeptide (TPR) repeat protein
MSARVLIALLLASCAHAPTHPLPSVLRCPAAGGPPWIELSSAHFHLRTDLSEDRGREVLLEFEKRFAATASLVDGYIPGGPSPGETDLVAFANVADFRRLIPDAGGIFRITDDRETPMIVLPASQAARRAHVAAHELIHRFLYRRAGDVPPWFNEGFAQYPNGYRLSDDYLKHIPSVSELVHGTASTFANDWGNNHVGAWALFEWLADGMPAQRDALHAFARDLVSNRDPLEAFAARIGKPEVLEPAFRDHLHALVAAKEAITSEPPAVDAGVLNGTRVLGEAELHFLWATVSRKYADIQVEDMRAHAKDSPLLHWLLAYLAESKGDYVTADDELDRSVALAPAEHRWRFERTIIRADRILDGRQPGASPASMLDELAAVARETENPRLLNSVAWVYAKLHRPDLGMPLARRAVATRPENGAYLDTLALLYYENRQVTDALRTQEEAVARASHWGRPSRGLTDRLTLYREEERAAFPDSSPQR